MPRISHLKLTSLYLMQALIWGKTGWFLAEVTNQTLHLIWNDLTSVDTQAHCPRCCSHASTLTVRMHFAGLERCQRSWCMPWTCLEHSCFSHGRARSPVPFGSFHLDFTFRYLYVCKPCPQGWHACAAWVPFTGLGGRLRDTHPIYIYNIYVYSIYIYLYVYIIVSYIYIYTRLYMNTVYSMHFKNASCISDPGQRPGDACIT